MTNLHKRKHAKGYRHGTVAWNEFDGGEYMQKISYQFATGYETTWLASWQAAPKYVVATTSAVIIEVEGSQNKQVSVCALGQRSRAGRWRRTRITDQFRVRKDRCSNSSQSTDTVPRYTNLHKQTEIDWPTDGKSRRRCFVWITCLSVVATIAVLLALLSVTLRFDKRVWNNSHGCERLAKDSTWIMWGTSIWKKMRSIGWPLAIHHAQCLSHVIPSQ